MRAPHRRTDAFWTAARTAPLVILTDFDGTITTEDIGTLIWQRLTPPSAETLHLLAVGEIGSRLAYLDSTARVNPAEGAALALEVAIDPHFKAFAAWTEQAGVPLAVVSDGFTFYIDPVLQREGLSHLPVFANEWLAPGELAWPHANPACDWCGCCKAGVVRRVKDAGVPLIYMGDGVSDLYAASFADYLFAKGRLARYLDEQGAPYFPFDSFAQPLALLQQHLELFRRGVMQRRNSLTAHPRCRFPESPLQQTDPC